MSECSSESESSNDSYTDEAASKLYEIMSNERYSDVILIVSDSIEFKSHRNLLGHSSKVFAKIFDNSDKIPVRICVKEFQAEIVKAALEFLYGNSNAIKRKEMQVFKFAEEYEIEELKKACIVPPERAMSAFYFWMGESRDLLKKPGMSVAEVAMAAGVEWKKVTDKSKWEKMAEDDKNRYDEELKFYQSHKNLITKA